MKLEMYEAEEVDGNIIKVWFEPETPEETRLLDKLKTRLGRTDYSMLKFIGSWFEEMESKKPRMLFKFPVCWEVNR